MSDIKTDLYKAYIEAIYDLNAEIFFNVAYEETSKGVYKLNKEIDKQKTSLTEEIKTYKDREEVIKKFRNFFENEIKIADDKDITIIKKTIKKNDFKEKLEYFNNVFYKNKNDELIEDINMKNFN